MNDKGRRHLRQFDGTTKEEAMVACKQKLTEIKHLHMDAIMQIDLTLSLFDAGLPAEEVYRRWSEIKRSNVRH
jgi:hypothetical protein